MALRSLTYSIPAAAKKWSGSRKPPTSCAIASDLARCSSAAPSSGTIHATETSFCLRTYNPEMSTFWQRISEGRELDELWGQFTADARASYGFYGEDVNWEEINQMSAWRRPFHIAKQIFWAL